MLEATLGQYWRGGQPDRDRVSGKCGSQVCTLMLEGVMWKKGKRACQNCIGVDVRGGRKGWTQARAYQR